MPLDVRAVYPAGSEVRISVLLNMPPPPPSMDDDDDGGEDDYDGGGGGRGGLPLLGGHFEFHLCPTAYPDPPTEGCFSDHPLEFFLEGTGVEAAGDVDEDDDGGRRRAKRREDDRGAAGPETNRNGDQVSYSNSDTVLISSVTTDGNGTTTITTLHGGTTILTGGPATSPNSRYVLLRWHYVPARDDCHPEGYDSYDWPTEAWGEWRRPTGGVCDDDDDDDDVGSPRHEEYWNCAEILILGDGDDGGDATGPSVTESLIPPLPTEPEPKATPPPPGDDDLAETAMTQLSDEGRITAVDDEVSTGHNRAITIDVVANDKYTGSLSLIVKRTTSANHGSCDVVNNQVLYTPSVGYDGWDNCSYRVCLSVGVCDEALINIKVLPASNPRPAPLESNPTTEIAITPLSDEGRITASAPGHNRAITIDVVANDKYTGSLSPVVKRTTSANHGSCDAMNNQVLYTPSDGYEGWDRCSYRVCLSVGVCDEALINIKVLPASNPRPAPLESNPTTEIAITPLSDEGRITASAPGHNRAITIDVVANDKYTGSLSPVVKRTTSANHGSCDAMNNQVLYTPSDGYEGWDRCSYRVCLSVGVCDEALINIKVLPASNPRPAPLESNPTTEIAITPLSDEGRITAVDDEVSTGHNRAITIDVVANDKYTGSLSPVVKRTTSANHGMMDMRGGNRCSYRVCLSVGVCDEALINIKVLPASNPWPAPLESNPTTEITMTPLSDEGRITAEDDEVSTGHNQAITIDVVANDKYTGSLSLIVKRTTSANHGTCDVVNNQVLYTPSDGYEGWDRCSYRVCLSVGVCDEALIKIEVSRPAPLEPNPTKPIPDVAPIEESVEEPMPTLDEPADVEPLEWDNGVDGGDNEGDEMEDEEDDTQEDKQVELEGPESTFSSGLESVYAEDEVVVTLQNTPIIVDVTNNDFSKLTEILKVTQTGGAEHGICALTSDNNQVHYIPEPDFLGTDHCGYIICLNSVCDEGILAIKVTSLKAENEPLPQKSSRGFVSNYKSSGGLSLMSTMEIPIGEIKCKEEYEGGRNLRGGGGRRLAKGDPCTPGSDGITYTSTYHTGGPPQLRLPSDPINPTLRVVQTGSPGSGGGERYIQTVISIQSSADAIITPDFPDKGFERVPSMLVSSALSSGGHHESWITVCQDGVFSASVFLYALANSDHGGLFVTTSDRSWKEHEVTWNNAPRSDGIVLGALGSIEGW
ncbi:LOW QUALITY PROTEIN: hypothetical protein ACHAW5_010065 [Stephanodiscus triporus]|uniref:Uncharacterized protein n=1 Tax=Stephanodiscus triporus TaxID=2934178 RepID=A0ABD3QNA0_9STRA